MMQPGSSVLAGTDAGMGAIGASFGMAAGIGGGIGDGALEAAAAGAGARRGCLKRPVMPFALPPGILTGTAAGDYLDLPSQFGPPTGWFWDVTMLALSGFTAGSVAVTRNAPAVTSSGTPVAVEHVALFSAAGVNAFPQKGNPLLAPGDRLVFTVTSALTGTCAVSGSVIQVPAERIDSYLS